MSQYIITYLGGNQPSSPEEGKKHFAKYMEKTASRPANGCRLWIKPSKFRKLSAKGSIVRAKKILITLIGRQHIEILRK